MLLMQLTPMKRGHCRHVALHVPPIDAPHKASTSHSSYTRRAEPLQLQYTICAIQFQGVQGGTLTGLSIDIRWMPELRRSDILTRRRSVNSADGISRCHEQCHRPIHVQQRDAVKLHPAHRTDSAERGPDVGREYPGVSIVRQDKLAFLRDQSCLISRQQIGFYQNQDCGRNWDQCKSCTSCGD